MIKTFQVLKSVDNTWTGGGIQTNDKYLEQIDEMINKYAKENKLKVDKVDYSILNEDTQIGIAACNVQKIVYLIASVRFAKRWF